MQVNLSRLSVACVLFAAVASPSTSSAGIFGSKSKAAIAT